MNEREESLPTREVEAFVESMKDAAIGGSVLPHHGRSEMNGEGFGAVEETALATEETDNLVRQFFEEACKDPAVLRSPGDRS